MSRRSTDRSLPPACVLIVRTEHRRPMADVLGSVAASLRAATHASEGARLDATDFADALARMRDKLLVGDPAT